jgi:hypothetical protein
LVFVNFQPGVAYPGRAWPEGDRDPDQQMAMKLFVDNDLRMIERCRED